MFRRILTHLIIFTLTVLPVQVISASAETVEMNMSMNQVMNECMHEQVSEQQVVEKSCCEEPSHQCDSCSNCPQVSSAMMLPSIASVKTHLVKIQNQLSSYLFLDGVPQKNLLRPPIALI